jgi:hypothetical protein
MRLLLCIGSGIAGKPADRKDVMTIHRVQTIGKNGSKEFAVLPYADFLKLQAELEDYEDLRCLREAKEAESNVPTIGLPEAKSRLLERTRTRRVARKPRGERAQRLQKITAI